MKILLSLSEKTVVLLVVLGYNVVSQRGNAGQL